MIVFIGNAQDSIKKVINKIPSIDIKNIDGVNYNTSAINNGGNPILVLVWQSCHCSVTELSDISELYDDWKTETGVKIYAINIDDTRNSSNIKPFVASKGWEFENLLDPNEDFKRAMNIVGNPYAILINGKGEIVWQKALLVEGMEGEILKEIEKIK